MRDFKTIQEELAQPFAPQDLEWRLQCASSDKTRGLAVPYVTSRAIQDRLDAVVGAENWRNEFQPWQGGKKGAQICGISIFVEERREWITKWDGAENTDIEAVKGGLSDSMKRAAVQWGIGRVLYKLPSIWVNVRQRGNSCYIPDEERPTLDGAYREALKKMNLIPAAPGGLQSKLDGLSDADAPRQGGASQPAGAAGQGPGQQTAQGSTNHQTRNTPSAQAGRSPQNTQQGSTRRDGFDSFKYTVLNYKVTHGTQRDTTRFLLLDTATGETMDVFLNGVDQRLVVNAELINVKITSRNQNNVSFLTLDAYEVLPPIPHAA